MIFGNDDRLDRYQLESDAQLSYSRSTAALTLKSRLKLNRDQTYSINFDIPGTGRAQSVGVCLHPFVGQPNLISYCSSTLIGPDLLLTSGHCFYRGTSQTPDQVCAESVALFDYSLNQLGFDPVRFLPDQIYSCKKLEIYAHQGDFDYAIVRLDREVKGREIFAPVMANRSIPLKTKYQYWTSGYPRGLPNKTILNAEYFDFWGTSNFTALFQMETMGGSSGSSIIDPVSRKIIGIVASSDCSDSEWSEEHKCFYEPIFANQCRGVRSVLLENLGIDWNLFRPKANEKRLRSEIL